MSEQQPEHGLGNGQESVHYTNVPKPNDMVLVQVTGNIQEESIGIEA